MLLIIKDKTEENESGDLIIICLNTAFKRSTK